MRIAISSLEIANGRVLKTAGSVSLVEALIHAIVGILQIRHQQSETLVFCRCSIVPAFTVRFEQEIYCKFFEGLWRPVHLGHLHLNHIDARGRLGHSHNERLWNASL